MQLNWNDYRLQTCGRPTETMHYSCHSHLSHLQKPRWKKMWYIWYLFLCLLNKNSKIKIWILLFHLRSQMADGIRHSLFSGRRTRTCCPLWRSTTCPALNPARIITWRWDLCAFYNKATMESLNTPSTRFWGITEALEAHKWILFSSLDCRRYTREIWICFGENRTPASSSGEQMLCSFLLKNKAWMFV